MHDTMNDPYLVIADDFSGAAEIAGIAWRFGLSSVVQTSPHISRRADVIVLDSDSRSGFPLDSTNRFSQFLHDLPKSNELKYYKKTDSVLRGEVARELEELMAFLRRKRCLLIPANPSRGRIIQNGQFYIRKRLLHETDFANDPEYPRRTSDVIQLVGKSEKFPVASLKLTDSLQHEGIFIADCRNQTEMTGWISRLEPDILPAGGSDFFSRLLEMEGLAPRGFGEETRSPAGKQLLVLGSAAARSRQYSHRLIRQGIPVCHSLFDPSATLKERQLLEDQWSEAILRNYQKSYRVALTVTLAVSDNPAIPAQLAEFTAGVVRKVLDQTEISQLVVAGGTTASRIVRRLNWQQLNPVKELATGVVRLQPVEHDRITLLVKPGSYPWPSVRAEEIF